MNNLVCPVFADLTARFKDVSFVAANNPMTKRLGLLDAGERPESSMFCAIFLSQDASEWMTYGALLHAAEPFYGDDALDIFLGWVYFGVPSELRICEDVLDPFQAWMRANVPIARNLFVGSSFVASTGKSWKAACQSTPD